MNQAFTAERASVLRRSAEEKLACRTDAITRSGSATQRLLHELQVHQVELEMQNEALQEALDRAETMQRFTDLYEYAPVAYLSVASDSTIHLLNQAGATLLGLERAQLQGQRLLDYVNADSKPLFNHFLKNVFASKGISTCEVKLRSGDGRPFIEVRIDAVIDKNGVACNLALTDVTEHRLLEEEIRRRDQRQRALIDNLPCLAWLKDEAGRYLAANSLFSDCHGHISPEELIGKDDLETYPREIAEIFRAEDQEVMTQGCGKRIERVVEINGHPRWFESFKSPVFLDGKVIGTAGFAHDITERRRAEHQIRESEERLKSFIENSPMMVISWDRDFKVTQWTGEVEKLLGWSAKEVLGKPIMDLHAIHEEDIPVVQAAMNTLLAGNAHSVISANRNITRDGRIIHSVWYNSAQLDCHGKMQSVLSQGLDITEQKLAEQLLVDSERSHRQLSQRLAEVIWGTNSGTWEWHIPTGELLCNERWAEIAGYTLEELSPVSIDTWLKLVHPEDLARADEQLNRCFSHDIDVMEIEIRMRCKNGDWVWVLSRGRVVERAPDGLPLRMSGTHQDVSRQKNAEAQMLDAKAEAERANQAKSRFLAAASHDLRQPLVALGLYIEVMQSRLGQSEVLLLRNISSCLSGLNELLNDLLEFSKLDAGVLVPEISDFSIAGLLASLVAVHAPEAKVKGLDFRCRPSRCIAHTDSLLLKRLVSNLVANAIRYTEHGGLLIACRRKQGKTWIEIWDTGVGIPQESLCEIFEEFRQLGNDERNHGCGLGLAIVARSAALLGLELRVKSRPGKGSLFAVELPRGKSRRKSLPQKRTPRSLCIALVNDSIAVLNALAYTLEAMGHQVIKATSGNELLGYLADTPPNIVISDFRLADGETGFDVITTARENFGEKLPALLITGDTDPKVMRKMAEHAIAVQHMPLDLDVLKTNLATLTDTASAEWDPRSTGEVLTGVRILLVDDHLMLRQALRTLLENIPSFELVGEAGDATQAAEMVEIHSPDVIVIDVKLPGIDGVEATRRLLAKHPKLRVIAISAYLDKQVVLDVFDAGALGYVAKSNAGKELVRAIFKVSQGERFLCREAAGILVQGIGARPS